MSEHGRECFLCCAGSGLSKRMSYNRYMRQLSSLRKRWGFDEDSPDKVDLGHIGYGTPASRPVIIQMKTHLADEQMFKDAQNGKRHYRFLWDQQTPYMHLDCHLLLPHNFGQTFVICGSVDIYPLRSTSPETLKEDGFLLQTNTCLTAFIIEDKEEKVFSLACNKFLEEHTELVGDPNQN